LLEKVEKVVKVLLVTKEKVATVAPRA